MTAPADLVLAERRDVALILTINRPAARNALDAATIHALLERLTAAGEDSSVRCLILTGSGDRAFCAGADIRQMREMSAEEGRRWGQLGHTLCDAIEHLDRPVIAAIRGVAVGGGLEVAMACDFRIASDQARLGQPEVTLGVIPGWGGTQRLQRLVGHGAAKELVLMGHVIDAGRALALGLVHAVVPADQVLPTALEWSSRLAALPPLAVAYAKRALNIGRDLDLRAANALEVDLMALCFATGDQKEGMAAFLEKRPARFEGR